MTSFDVIGCKTGRQPPNNLMTFKQFRQLLFDYWYLPAGLVLISAVLFGIDRCGTWRANRDIAKDKQKIANTVAEISNISNQIGNLEQQKAEKQGELNRDLETLANNVYGRDEIKKEANAALGNYQRAVNANANTNATARQIEDALKKLEGQ